MSIRVPVFQARSGPLIWLLCTMEMGEETSFGSVTWLEPLNEKVNFVLAGSVPRLIFFRAWIGCRQCFTIIKYQFSV